jgi:alpha-methylacyl-CoA racemase
MMFADHGAEVIRVERPGAVPGPVALDRSRRSVAVDLKSPEGVAVVRDLARTADALIEGFRPGVMERLGLGPDILLGDNPRLVYGRMTGYGQTGPLAQHPGHDIDYIATVGLLDGIGLPGEPPVPPANYVGDFGGGAMMLCFGMLAALLHVRGGGRGQVIDAAMTDGASVLASMTWAFRAVDMWRDGPGVNLLTGAAPFYTTYVCADGKAVAVGAIEPQFYAALLDGLGLTNDPTFASQMDLRKWDAMKWHMGERFATRARDEWKFAPEACVVPVLTIDEAATHPHNLARDTFIWVGDKLLPAPAPRYSVTACADPRPPVAVGSDTDAVLRSLGYDEARITMLRASGAIA